MGKKVSAADIQASCWSAMEKLHKGDMDAARANAIASNAREVLRAARVRVAISGTPGLSPDLYDFANEKT